MRHQLTHSSEKPFSCPYCDFSTAGSTSLTSHVRNVHKEFDFTAGRANKIKKKEERINAIPSAKAAHMQNIVNKECESICLDASIVNPNNKHINNIQQPRKRKHRHINNSYSSNQSSLLTEGDATTASEEPVITVLNADGQLVRAVVKVKKSRQDSGPVLHVVMES